LPRRKWAASLAVSDGWCLCQPICPLGAHRQVETEMQSPERPKLRFLHSEDVLSPVKLEAFRRLSTDAIESSLHPGQPGSLKVRTDGTVLDGHHRLFVLLERRVDIHELPREIMERDL